VLFSPFRGLTSEKRTPPPSRSARLPSGIRISASFIAIEADSAPSSFPLMLNEPTEKFPVRFGESRRPRMLPLKAS
jgi:hypothetical protein